MITTGPNLEQMDNGLYGEENYHEFLSLLRALDLLVQPHVKSAATTAPPETPAEGDAYIVPADATGAWDGKDTKIARWTARSAAGSPPGTATWEYFTPKKGWLMGVDDTDSHVKFNGTAWVAFGS